MNIKSTTEKLIVDDVNMAGSQFQDVNLADSNFSNIDLTQARFNNVNLKNAQFTDCNIEGLTINGILITDLMENQPGQQS